MRIACSSLLLLALPAVAFAESWALLGLRDAEGVPVAGELHEVREILVDLLPEGDFLLSAEEFAQRLGLPVEPPPDPVEALTEAELLFFQLEYEKAQERLEQAIDAIARGRVAFTPELGRSLRLLSAHIHLQRGDRGQAEAILRPLASLAALPESARRAVGEEVASLWDEVRAAAAARAEGWLVVDCTGCHGGEVWLEGVPVGTTQQSIGLIPGAYHVVLRGLAGSEGKRSLSRVVRIQAGRETRIAIDLGAEAALLGEGPALLDEGEVSFRRAAYLAGRLGVDRLLAWRFGPGTVEVRDVSPAGVRGTWSTEVGEGGAGEAKRELVAAILGGPETAFAGAVSPEPPPTPEPRPTEAPEEVPPFLRQGDRVAKGMRPVARWTALGATVAMVAGAGWLTANAASAGAELDRLESRPGSYRSVQEARRAKEVAQMIEARRNWSAVLWTGAAVGAVGTLLLFLDADEGEPAR